MKLKEYLKREGLTLEAFGQHIDATAGEVHAYCNGRKPRDATMARIFEATGGAVTPNDFYDLPELQNGAVA